MELERLEEGEHDLTFKVVGEDHTFCNALRSVLLEDANVVNASYTVEHPLLEAPKFHVRVKRGSPELALTRAAQRMLKSLEELREKLLKALKE